jgi:uncharacterized membrane protein
MNNSTLKLMLVVISASMIITSIVMFSISNKENQQILKYQQQINSKLDSMSQMKKSIDSLNNIQQYQSDDIEIK